MNKKVCIVLFAVLMMAVMTVSVSADQLANDRWCNSDQYGCWVTGDNGAQDYIMFWSESARELFMGPGSNAVVTDPYPAGKMPLGPAPAPEKSLVESLYDALVLGGKLAAEKYGREFNEKAYMEGFWEEMEGKPEEYIRDWLKTAVDRINYYS